MKHYKVFINQEDECEAVKQGWSWPAFFFGWVWALVKKLWTIGVGFIVVFLLIGYFTGGGSSGNMTLLAAIMVKIFFGINGNSWRESSLTNRGYKFKDTVTAANPGGAIAQYRANPKQVDDNPPMFSSGRKAASDDMSKPSSGHIKRSIEIDALDEVIRDNSVTK